MDPKDLYKPEETPKPKRDNNFLIFPNRCIRKDKFCGYSSHHEANLYYILVNSENGSKINIACGSKETQDHYVHYIKTEMGLVE